MKKIIKIILGALAISCISTIVVMYLAFNSRNGGGMAQYLRHLDYNVQMQNDGSMEVVETWDIDVGNTNTLLRTIKLNKSKFGKISNVKIQDLETGKEFKNINTEKYHVPEGSFYALQMTKSDFEIAFGVGMDFETRNRKFQISYTIEDVVTDYKDCQEIYWKFLSEGQNLIPAEKVTGTITLPQEVSNLDNLLIWGHGQLNGTINKVNNSQVKFEIDDLSSGAMIEIRLVTKDDIFQVNSNKVKNYNHLEKILDDEGKWAQTTNKGTISIKIVIFIVIIVYIIAILSIIIRVNKGIRINKRNYIKKEKLKYFRDIPRETATPAEATYLYKFNKKRLNTSDVQSEAVAATILDLCYKKKIELSTDKYKKVFIKIIADSKGLKKDELEIYKLLANVGAKDEKIEISQLETYAKKKYRAYSNIINRFVRFTRDSLYDLKLIDKLEEKMYSELYKKENNRLVFIMLYIVGIITYYVMQIPNLQFRLICYYGNVFVKDSIIILIALAPIILLYIWYSIIKTKIENKMIVLTQEGSEEQDKWKGLANYMEDYSLLNEKDVLSLEIWEKYLIYATAFGIADKVIEQMKAKYPEVFIQENWNDENLVKKYPVINFALNPTYNTDNMSFSHSILRLEIGTLGAYRNSMREISMHSIRNSSSSGSGGGGGFSGGGGGRRWPADGMSGR